MVEYIEREAVIAKYKQYLAELDGVDNEFAISVMRNEPSADVVEVKHGRWESVKNPQWPAYSHDKCSICGWWNTKNALCYDGHNKPGHSLNYCPNCGARMDGADQ